MKRIELFLDNQNNLTLHYFNNLYDEYEQRSIKGKSCGTFIELIANNPLIKIIETHQGENITLQYENYVVTINEYEKFGNVAEIKPLINDINNYITKFELEKHKRKKVTRKNKHAGKRIIVSALLLIIISSSLYISNVKANQSSPDFEIITTIESTTNHEKTPEEIINEVIKESTTNSTKETQVVETTNKENDMVVSLDYNDRSKNTKAYNTETSYGNIISKYSKMYGLDPELIIAIATQERGVHSTRMDKGGATGLMQIQNSVWRNENLSAYNYNTGKTEMIRVDEAKLSDLEYNVKVGCMIFQNAMNYMKNNVLAAIQCYNMGYGNMQKILRAYSYEKGKSIDETLSDSYDTGWLKYRQQINQGDQKYLEHVLSWMGDEVSIDHFNQKGETSSININNKVK